MTGRNVQFFSIAVALTVTSLLAGTASAQYRVTRIVTLHGDAGLPRALNVSGQAVGGSGEPHGGDTAAFIAQHGGKGVRLSALPGGDYSEAFAINDLGDVAGSSNTATSVRPVSWSSSRITQLNLPDGMTGGEAFAINNNGSIAGYVSGPAGMQASLWTRDGAVRLLPLQRGQISQATAINGNDEVAGWLVKNGVSQAFVWNASHGLSLLPSGGPSKAHGINDSRQIVGSCSGPEGDRACLWTPDGVQQLGMLPGGELAEAFDINNAGTVVGSAGTSLGLRAFVWTRADGMRDLNALIPSNSAIVLSVAVAINERGEILAYGSRNHDLEQDRAVDLDHGVHAGPTFVFLLTPIR